MQKGVDRAIMTDKLVSRHTQTYTVCKVKKVSADRDYLDRCYCHQCQQQDMGKMKSMLANIIADRALEIKRQHTMGKTGHVT